MQVQTIVVLLVLILLIILVWQLTQPSTKPTPKPTPTPTPECQTDSDCSSAQYCVNSTCTFDNRPGSWVQRGLSIVGEAVDDQSGWSVSLSADASVVAVGAIGNDGTGVDAGHTRVFDWDGSAWVQRGLDIEGEAAGDQSGYSVSLSADGVSVAVGAPFNSTTGHTRIFDWDGSAWTQRGTDIDGEAASDFSGASVSLSPDGDTVAIGARGAATSTGHTRIFDWDGSAWTQRGTTIVGEAASDRSGQSVSLSGDANTVAIGALFNDGSGSNAGHTRIFDWDGSAWTQRGADIDGEAVDDLSGTSVSLSTDGNTVAIGATGNDGTGVDAGHTRIFDWDGSAWTQRGADIDGEAAGDFSGTSVSLSGDGAVVAIGAPQNTDGGAAAGQTRIFAWDGTTWTQRGLDIDGAANDQSGYSVSLSPSGTTVTVGGNTAGSSAGVTLIYDWVLA